MKVSIIIRTKNEERWISSCLESVFNQDHQNFEVILVDNNSTDATVSKAQKFPIKVIDIDEFKPGDAINQGIKASSGDILVCLSGHCIPVNNYWLSKLVSPLSNSVVAGVYGRQQPMSFTTDRDKRDLLITFGLDYKIQKKDTFFHNANSAFRRDTWEKYPFDERIKHIEDRLWARDVLSAEMQIHYEPEASVYHFHGIHQDDNPQRRRNIVQILENLSVGDENTVNVDASHPGAPNPKDLNTIALIPVRGDPVFVGEKPLLEYTLEQAKESKFIDKIFVLTDSEKTAQLAIDNGVEAPFLRPKELSRDFIDIAEVLKFGVDELVNWGISPDLCVVLEETYPFRPQNITDELITQLLREGLDCAIAVKPESRSIWVEQDGNLETISPLIPRKMKMENYFVSLFGLCFVTYPTHIRDRTLGMDNPSVYEIDDPIAMLEVRNKDQCERVAGFLNTNQM